MYVKKSVDNRGLFCEEYYGFHVIRGTRTVMNITLSIDEETVRKARKVAIDRNTTLTGMVRDFLREAARCEETERRRAVFVLRKTFSKYGRDMGERTWRREDIHER
jgi:hypothetical protein